MTESRTTVAGRRRKSSSLATNLLLTGAAVIAALLVCELVLRAMGISYPVYVWMDPIRGVAHIPGAKSSKQYQGHSWIEINGDGLMGPEAAPRHPPGTFRIALLGDSFIEAFEVPYEKTVGEVIEQRLSPLRGTPVEVLNYGQGGYGTAQEFLTLQYEVWKFSPDLVLLAITTGNDISDNYRPLKRTDYVPYFVFQGTNLVLDSSFRQSKGYRSRAVGTKQFLTLVQHSRLAQLINRVRHTSRKSERRRDIAGAVPGDELGLRDEVQKPPATPEWKEAWRVTEGILRLMRDECRTKGTPFAIVTLTRGIQVTPVREKKEAFMRQLGVENLYYPERRLAEFGEREGIPVLNLAPAMAKQAEERQVYFHAHHDSLGVGHWNEAGHLAAGELIAPWLATTFPKSP
jgi:hypothetical protein